MTRATSRSVRTRGSVLPGPPSRLPSRMRAAVTSRPHAIATKRMALRGDSAAQRTPMPVGGACGGPEPRRLRPFPHRPNSLRGSVDAVVRSKSRLGGPALIATDRPCTISPASGPTMCAATTRSVSPSTSSFISVRSSRPVSVCFMGRKRDSNTWRAAKRSRARSSVGPTVPILGWQKTAVAISVSTVPPRPNRLWRCSMPSAIATG